VKGEYLGFYEIAAQIIPVVFLAFLVEWGFSRQTASKAEEPPPERPWREEIFTGIAFSAVVGLFVVGETLALWVLAEGEGSAWKKAMVASCLATGSWYLVVRVVEVALRRSGHGAVFTGQVVVTLGFLAGLLYSSFA
jgi:sterol desaturase/sphingolipid hydroxylase (fatty acid hydroxylase superfamily)